MRGEASRATSLLTWTPVTYSQRLVPLPSSATTALPNHKAPPPATAVFAIEASAGFMSGSTGIGHPPFERHRRFDPHYRTVACQDRVVRGGCVFRTLGDSDETVPPDGQEHAVVLKTDTPGLYRLEMTDGGDATQVVFEPGERSFGDGSGASPTSVWPMDAVFLRAPGTPVVGATEPAPGGLWMPKVKVRYQADRADGADYFTIQTPEGPDQDDAADHFIIQIPKDRTDRFGGASVALAPGGS